jgi:hypothetical protein
MPDAGCRMPDAGKIVDSVVEMSSGAGGRIWYLESGI